MRNMPVLYQTIERRKSGETVGTAETVGGAPDFPVPTFPTAHILLKLGLTRNDGGYAFHRHDVALSVPFDQENLDQVYAAMKKYVSMQLNEIDSNRRPNPDKPFSTEISVSQKVPKGPVMAVPYSGGRTVPLKNMESARIELSLTLLSDPGKTMEAFQFAFEWVEGVVEKIASGVKAAMG